MSRDFQEKAGFLIPYPDWPGRHPDQPGLRHSLLVICLPFPFSARMAPCSERDPPDAGNHVKMSIVTQHRESVLVGERRDPGIIWRDGMPNRFNSRRMSA